MNKKLQNRKRNRLEHFDYNACGAYFITICTSDKRNYFWNDVGATIGRPQDIELSQYGKIVDEAINNIPSVYPALKVDHYVIMPDHIHLLLMITDDQCPSPEVSGDLDKTTTDSCSTTSPAKRLYKQPMVAPTISRVIQQLKGYITKRIGYSIWQKLFFDHVIRDRQDYEEHIKYICNNPAKLILRRQNSEKKE
ncbi:MAG: transposase [Christensenellaceae bacterium]